MNKYLKPGTDKKCYIDNTTTPVCRYTTHQVCTTNSFILSASRYGRRALLASLPDFSVCPGDVYHASRSFWMSGDR